MAERKILDECEAIKDGEDCRRTVTSHNVQPEVQQNNPQMELGKTKQSKQKHKESTVRRRVEKKKVIESSDIESQERLFNEMVAEATKQSRLQHSSAHTKPTIRTLTDDSKRTETITEKHPVSYSTIEALINRNNSSGGKVLVQNTAEDTSSNERPPFTTKAESLSRELSPSRITAQMQSVLSESYRSTSQTETNTADTFRNNLLHSALTGMLNQSPGRVSPTRAKTPPKVKGKGISSSRLPPKKDISPGVFKESPQDHIIRTAKLPPEINQQRSGVLIKKESPVSDHTNLHCVSQTHPLSIYTTTHAAGSGQTSLTDSQSFHQTSQLSKLGMIAPTSAITSTRVAPVAHIVSASSEIAQAVQIPHNLQEVVVPVSGERPKAHSPFREILLAEQHEAERRYSPHVVVRRTLPSAPPSGWISSKTPPMPHTKQKAPASVHEVVSQKIHQRIPSPQGHQNIPSPHGHQRIPSPKGHQTIPSPQGSQRVSSPARPYEDQSTYGSHMSPHGLHQVSSPYTIHTEQGSYQERSSPFKDTTEGKKQPRESPVVFRTEHPVSQSSSNVQHCDQSSPLSAGFQTQSSDHRLSLEIQNRHESPAIPPPAHLVYVQKPSEKSGVSKNEQSAAVDLTKVHKYSIAVDRKAQQNAFPVLPCVEGLMALCQIPATVTSEKIDLTGDNDHPVYVTSSKDSFHPATKDILKTQQPPNLPCYPGLVTNALSTISVMHPSSVSETVVTQSVHPVSSDSLFSHSVSKHHTSWHPVSTHPVSVQSKGPLPPHINPFTFPPSLKVTAVQNTLTVTASSVKSPDKSDTRLPKEHSPVIGPFLTHVNNESLLPSSSDKECGSEMPKLVPEVCLLDKNDEMNKYSIFNHVDEKNNDLLPLENPFNMRLQNLASFPPSNPGKTGYRSQSVAVLRAKTCSITSAAKSLDLLRQNLQKCINKDIDNIIQSYIEKYFNPGIANIRLNNGPNSVNDDHVHLVCRQILEEAKRMYSTERRSVTPVNDNSDNVSESGSINGRRSNSGHVRKRRPSDSNSESGKPEIIVPKKKKKGRPPLNQTGRGTPSKMMRSEPLRQGPKWDPERLTTDSLFVMGARANKALGLGNTRGRLYIKHPDVFKYSGDQDDKAWLYEHQLMPVTGGKAYMLLVEDIKDLSETDEYRDSPNLMMDELKGFKVPEFMIVKMRADMMAQRTDVGTSVSHRSRSGTPVEERESKEHPQDIPFSSFSTPTSSTGDVKSESRVSPGGTEEMEFLSTADNEEQNDQDLSPLHMTSTFEDAGSTSPTDLDSYDGDPQLPASFTYSK